MPTLVTRYVNTASSGGDGTTNGTSGATAAYASLSAAIAAEAKDLVTADENYEFLCDGGADTTPVTDTNMSAWVCDATRDIVIKPNTGNEAGTSLLTDRYRLSVTSANHTFAYNRDNIWLKIERLQLRNAPTTGSNNTIEPRGSGRIWLDKCFLEKDQSGGGNASVYTAAFSAGDERLTNCIFYQHGGATPSSVAVRTLGVMYNCTIIAETSENAIANGDFGTSGGHVKNNLIENRGSGAAFQSDWTPTASASNQTDDATSPDGAAFRNATATFAGAADFALTSGDTVAKNNGTDLSADAQYAFSDDILANSRPNTGGSWDIGAHEEQTAAGGGSNIPAIMNHRRIQGMS